MLKTSSGHFRCTCNQLQWDTADLWATSTRVVISTPASDVKNMSEKCQTMIAAIPIRAIRCATYRVVGFLRHVLHMSYTKMIQNVFGIFWQSLGFSSYWNRWEESLRLPSPAGVLTFCSVRNTLLACEKIAIIRNPNHELRLHNMLHTFSVSIRLNRSQTLTFWQYRFEGCLKSCLSTDPPRSWQPWSRDVSVKCWTKHDRHDSTGFNRIQQVILNTSTYLNFPIRVALLHKICGTWTVLAWSCNISYILMTSCWWQLPFASLWAFKRHSQQVLVGEQAKTDTNDWITPRQRCVMCRQSGSCGIQSDIVGLKAMVKGGLFAQQELCRITITAYNKAQYEIWERPLLRESSNPPELRFSEHLHFKIFKRVAKWMAPACLLRLK